MLSGWPQMPEKTQRQEAPRQGVCLVFLPDTAESSNWDSHTTEGHFTVSTAPSLVFSPLGQRARAQWVEEFPGGLTYASPGRLIQCYLQILCPLLLPLTTPASIFLENHSISLKTDHGDVDKEDSFPLRVYTHILSPAAWRDRMKRQVIPAREQTAFPSSHPPPPSRPYKGLAWQTHTLWGPARAPLSQAVPRFSSPPTGGRKRHVTFPL